MHETPQIQITQREIIEVKGHTDHSFPLEISAVILVVGQAGHEEDAEAINLSMRKVAGRTATTTAVPVIGDLSGLAAMNRLRIGERAVTITKALDGMIPGTPAVPAAAERARHGAGTTGATTATRKHSKVVMSDHIIPRVLDTPGHTEVALRYTAELTTLKCHDKAADKAILRVRAAVSNQKLPEMRQPRMWEGAVVGIVWFRRPVRYVLLTLYLHGVGTVWLSMGGTPSGCGRKKGK